MGNRIYLASPTMHQEEQVFIQEAFDTNWVAPLGKNVDLAKLADDLEGLTGADIACLVREAAYVCLRRSLDLEGLLDNPGSLPENRLRSLRVTTRDLRSALKTMRHRKESLAI